jgi:hypothetical protein
VFAKRLVGREPGDREFRDDHRVGLNGESRFVFVVTGVEDAPGRRLDPRDRRISEHETLAADRNLVPGLEPTNSRQRHTIDEGAVAAPKVFDRDTLSGYGNGCVLPAHRGQVENEVAVWMPAEEHSPGSEQESFAVSGTRLKFKCAHEVGSKKGAQLGSYGAGRAVQRSRYQLARPSLQASCHSLTQRKSRCPRLAPLGVVRRWKLSQATRPPYGNPGTS